MTTTTYAADRTVTFATRSLRRTFRLRGRSEMNQSIEEKNKTLVLHAFETLFNKRDYAVAERYWSPEIYPA